MKASFTDQNFDEEVIKASATKPVVVDFRADWCGPCKLLDPVIEELATEYQGKLTIGSLDVDANQATAGKYSIMSIPSVLFFKNGKVVGQTVGFQGKEVLVKELNALLG
jgi:thioredoxin 1